MTNNGNKKEYAKLITFSYITLIRERLIRYLRDPFLLNSEYSQITNIKSESHNQYELDNVAQAILIETLEKENFKGRVFSEEAGWFSLGDYKDLKLICDPFDSTFLTTRSINFPAVSLCFIDKNNQFICSAVADLSNDITYFADNTGACAFIYNNGKWLSKGRISVSNVEKIEEAFIVLPTMQPNRRAHLDAKIFQNSCFWLNACGATFIGKLASGFIDAYLDPFKGQPLYEIACAEIILRAGGVVSNKYGEQYKLKSIIELLEKGDDSRYTIVASSTKELHRNLLKSIES